MGTVPSDADPCVYLVGPAESRSFVIIYVDNILIISNDDSEMSKLKNHLKSKFDVRDLGDVKDCLGLEFTRSKKEITVRQRGYICDVLNRFGMFNCKPVSTPLEPGLKLVKEGVESGNGQCETPYRELMGALMYLSVGTRPDSLMQSAT